MFEDKSAVLLGLALGVMIVTVGIIGMQTYYNPNVAEPSDAEYQIEVEGNGFLISVDAEHKLTDDVTIEIIHQGTDSQTIQLTPPHTGTPVYVQPEADINEVQSIMIKYQGETLENHFVSQELDSQLEVNEPGNFTVRPNQNLEISIDRFVNNTDVIDSYTWDTGLQIIENKSFSESYNNDGEYSGSLVLTDNQGRTYNTEFNIIVGAGSSQTQNVELPNNNISVVTKPNSKLSFESSIVDNTLREVDEYRWNFGDGVKINGKRVIHQYSEQGTYNVTMTAVYTNGDVETHNSLVKVQDEESTGLLIEDMNGYEFRFSVHANESVSESSYEWDLGDGTTVQGREVVVHTYDEYGEYNMTVSYETSTGDKKQLSGSVQTEVLVEMGNEPYSVQSVSGDYEDELMPNDEIGDQNPALKFDENVRYRITNIPTDTQFESENGNVLLSQDGAGSFENDPDVNWHEVSEDTIEFTVTEELGDAIYTYVPVDN